MQEKRIYLKEIDPVEIYGANNLLIDRLRKHYPLLKSVVRGEEIYLKGEEKDIESFEEKIYALIETRSKKRKLTADDIDSLFSEEGDGNEGKEDSANGNDIILYGNEGRIIRARTKNQKKLLSSYRKCDMIFITGPAGTGKTYTAIALAVKALKNREVRRIVLTRPAVEAGERLGFLPGDLKEKLDPYLQPLYDALQDMIPAAKLKQYIEDGTIQIAPLAYMRGRTLDSAFVILDEAQNTTIGQMKMFVTRMGNNAKFLITGDATQTDLPSNQESGLTKAIGMLREIPGIGVIEMTREDIVRHKLVEKIIQAFDKME